MTCFKLPKSPLPPCFARSLPFLPFRSLWRQLLLLKPSIKNRTWEEAGDFPDRTQAVECRRENTMPSSVDHHILLMRANYLMILMIFMASFSFKLYIIYRYISCSSLCWISCWLLNWHDFFQGCWGEVVSYKKIRFGDVHLSPMEMSACWNMLKLPGQGEGQKCGCWAYMARDWCFSQRTGMGGLMLVFSWRHVWICPVYDTCSGGCTIMQFV